MLRIKFFFKLLFRKFGISFIKVSTLEKLLEGTSHSDLIEFFLKMPSENILSLVKYSRKSKSQIHQDLFVLAMLNFKTNGFFVEFGAADGINLSNSYLLEKEFGWKGILAEPAKCWHKNLKKNRACSIETSCLWKDSISTLTFNEVEIAELSTINSYSGSDLHKELRKNGNTYDVKTISLNGLLEKYDAPRIIDYLSIDTEGSEFEILSNFDFSKYSINVITVEHNFSPKRDELFNLLTGHGYIRVYRDISHFDDWYVNLTQQPHTFLA
jgi:FkbM family methyltransferase